ncbi:hypothetical protein BDW74DRAFT_182582 [Aspergillus multicolor]|uniref:uncharacterized protein n=1 Tax=Aspergillus multicolor TaxID=41759 RepID=UPI003CCD33E7
MGEVTVKIYSLASKRHFLPPPSRPASEWNEAKKYLALPDEKRVYDKASFMTALVMWEQLRVVFGNELFLYLHYLSRRTEDQNDDSDKRHFFATRTAKYVNLDLSDYFARWGLGLEQRTIDEMKTLPKPSKDYSKVSVYGDI